MASTKVQELKEQGNECVKAKKYAEAILHYSHAIKVDPSQYQLYSNRSLAFLKMDQYYLALEDANETIKLKPDWAKGYYRKAEVEFHAEQYETALLSYQKSLLCELNDPALMDAVKRTKLKLDELKRSEARIPWIGAGIGFIVGILIIVGDIVVAEQSILKYPLLQALMIIVISGVGYGLAYLYRHYARLQRSSALEPPIDLLDLDEGKNDATKDGVKADEKHRFSKAAARQRYKKGKN